MRVGLAITMFALALTGCGEKPPRGASDVQPGPALERGAGIPLRERALSQGESARIYQ